MGNYVPPAPGSGGSAQTTSPNPFSGSQERIDNPVLVDPGVPPSPSGIAGVLHAGETRDTGATYSDTHTLVGQLYTMDPSALQELQTQLRLAGYGDVQASGFVDARTVNAYQGLLTDARLYQDQNPQAQITPDSLLSQRVAAQNAAAAQGGGTTSSQAYVLTDPNMARQLVNNSLDNHLGRRATADEQAQFFDQVRSSEMAAPDRETSSYGGVASGGSPYVPKSRVTVSQRPDPAAMADAFSRGTQGRADEVGAQNEVDFTNVLARLLGAGH